MTNTPSFATPERDRNYPAAGNWRVLARLADVSDELPSAERTAGRRSKKGALDYRFDPPEKPAGGVRSDRNAEYQTAKLPIQTTAGEYSHRPPQPHLFQRARRGDYSPQPPRGESPVLPRWDPFSIPASRVPDTIAPLIRFLVLVALFTAAGTTILTMGKRNQASPAEVESGATVVRQSLEPATPADTTTSTTPQEPATPTAMGPVGAAATFNLEVPPGATATASANTKSLPVQQPAAAAPHATRDTAETETGSAASTPDSSLPPLTRAEGGGLPHVQLSDPPVAVARLQGVIEEIPTRQAKNDEDEPSLY